MILKTNVEGEHNGIQFTLHNGFLTVCGIKLTKKEIQSIVEISTLLTAQGYNIRESEKRVRREPSWIDQIDGALIEYEDDEEDFNR